MTDTSFADFVLEQLRSLRGVAARRMFGGVGLYRQAVMFGVIFGDELFLKVGDDNRSAYEAAGSRPFVYSARGRKVSLSYWRVPEDVLEDADVLAAWATRAHAVAVNAAKAKTRKRKR